MIYPDLTGTWNYQIVNFRRTDPVTPPSFSTITKSNYNVTIEQNDDFLIITVPANPPLRPTEGYQMGLVSKVYNNIDNFWQVTLADFDDTGVINLTVKEYESECNCNNEIVIFPTVLEGYYVESGFSSINPNQNQAIAKITFTRIQ